MEHNQNTITTINYQGAYGPNFTTVLDFFISRYQNWPFSRGYIGSWGQTLVANGVVERWPL